MSGSAPSTGKAVGELTGGIISGEAAGAAGGPDKDDAAATEAAEAVLDVLVAVAVEPIEELDECLKSNSIIVIPVSELCPLLLLPRGALKVLLGPADPPKYPLMHMLIVDARSLIATESVSPNKG